MSHVDDGQLNALLDGELAPEERVAVEAHLAACAECRARLEEARTFLTQADALLGVIVPPVAVDAVVSPARPVAPPVPSAVPRRTSVTAKERAIDLDGATHQSPAIRLPPPPPPPPAPPAVVKPPRRAWPVRNLAWAASIVLTFGVGYLANGILGGPGAGPSSQDQALATRADTARREPVNRPATARQTPQAPRPARHTAGATRTPPRTPAARQPAAADKHLAPPPRADVAIQSPSPTAGAGAGLAAESRAQQAPAANIAAATPGPALGAVSRVTALPARFVRVPLDTAVVRLQGTVRLIDGMHPLGVEIGPGRLVAGAARDLAVIRVHYADAHGRRIVLEQQRLTAGADVASGLGVDMLYGDTVVSTAPGSTRIRWLDNRNFWLSLEGPLGADSLRALADRVR